MNVTTRQNCRLCATPFDDPFLHFPRLPVAGVYLRKDELGGEPCAPLSVHCCRSCGLVQLAQEVSQDFYREYRFSGGHSARYRSHVANVAQVVQSLDLPAGSLIVEVGSNDGTLLRCMGGAGYEVIGFEPARTFDDDQPPTQVRVIHDFFSQAALDEHGVEQADVLVARHVLEHVPRLDDFVSAIRRALVPGGWVILEVPDAVSLHRGGVVTNFLHEHNVYFTSATLTELMTRHGFSHVRSTWVEAHCGSILAIYRKDHTQATSEVAPQLAERIGPAAWTDFAWRAGTYLKSFGELLQSLRVDGPVVGYGSAQRTTTLIGMADLGEGALDYFVDKNPNHHGLYLPVVHRPIHSPDRLVKEMPRHAVILAQSFEEEIVEENEEYLRRGGTLVSTRDAAFRRIAAA